MSYKRLIPCIFIAGGKAVRWFHDDEIISEDVVGLARSYSDLGADELIIFDLSETDDEHEASIDLIRRIGRVIRIPMVAGGNIRRQEDVKKILYAGAKRVIINFAKYDCVEMMEEAKLRFGKEKIAVYFCEAIWFRKEMVYLTYTSTPLFIIKESQDRNSEE